MNVQKRLFSYTSITVDRHAALLAGLFAAVIGVSLYGYAAITAAGVSPEPILGDSTPGQQAAAGGIWAIGEAAFAGLLVVLILVWRKLPDWLQDDLKESVKFGIVIYIGYWAATTQSMGIVEAIAWAIGIYLAYGVIDQVGFWWVVNNLGAIGLAIMLGLAGGLVLGVPFLLVGLIGLSIYDHYFANENSWMFTLGGALVRLRIPILIIIPSYWRLDWLEMADAIEQNDDDADDYDEVSMGIGMADVALPAMFAVAVAAAAPDPAWLGVPVAAWGVLAGVVVACLRLRWVMLNRGSGAGLPALATGSIGGWAVGLVAAWMLLLV